MNDPNPYIQARAIWLLAKLGPEGITRVESRLTHKDPQMRIAAFRALRHENHRVLEHAAALASDRSPLVRREVALALRYVPFEQSRDLLLKLAKGYDGEDRYYVEAWGIGCTDKEEKMYAALRSSQKNGFDPVYAGLVWRLHPVSALPELEAWALASDLDAKTRRSMLFAISLIEAPQAAASMVKIAQTADGDLAALATAFIDKRGQGIWSVYKPKDLLAGKPAGPVTYRDMLPPDVLGAETDLPSPTEILALKGDATKGKVLIARCMMCHQIGDAGVEFGPALAGWGHGQPREVILKALLDPSADLSHGFQATELTVKGGKRLQGFMQAEGDPAVIRVFGGQDVVVAKADIESRKTLKQSLMVSAAKMGLQAQELRDMVEYLKTQ